jgi:hypothetical protein
MGRRRGQAWDGWAFCRCCAPPNLRAPYDYGGTARRSGRRGRRGRGWRRCRSRRPPGGRGLYRHRWTDCTRRRSRRWSSRANRWRCCRRRRRRDSCRQSHHRVEHCVTAHSVITKRKRGLSAVTQCSPSRLVDRKGAPARSDAHPAVHAHRGSAYQRSWQRRSAKVWCRRDTCWRYPTSCHREPRDTESAWTEGRGHCANLPRAFIEKRVV